MTAVLALAVVSTLPPCNANQGAVSRADASARVDAIRELLGAEREAFRAWQAAWVTAMAVSVVGQAGVGNATEQRGRRAALWVGAGKAVLGLSAVLTMPDRRPPSVWPEDVCQQLRVAEAALEELARVQARAVAPWRHVASVGVNLAASLYIGLAHDEWILAVTSGLIGAVVGQAILRTRPDGAVEARDSGLAFTLAPGGVGLVWRF